MTIENRILKSITAACEAVVPALLWRQHRCLVAVSGGADSVTLFRVLVHIASENPEFDVSKIIVGHVDHAVRGADSQADRMFVQRLAGEFGAGFVATRLDLETLLGQRETVSEDLLREARYKSLKKMAQDNDARYLFTGHHLNDQAETILFRIFRGTGLAGLKGIPAIRRDGWLTIVRPLLKVPKSVILEALDSLQQPFCTDATNTSSDFGRNFLRNEILKSAHDYFGLPVEEAIARLADHAGDAIALEAHLVKEYFTRFPLQADPDGVVLPTGSLASEPKSLVRAILIHTWQQRDWPVSQMTFDRWQGLAERVSTASSTLYVDNLPGNLRFEADQDTIKISSSGHAKQSASSV